MNRNYVIGLLILTLVGVSGCAVDEPVNPGLDFSAMAPFWVVQDRLAADREPSDAEWAVLLGAPGYRALTRSEFSDEFFQDTFRLAYMPSRNDELEQALAEGNRARFLRHYQNVAQRRDELERHQAQLQSTPLFESTVRKTREYLPAGEPSGQPQVAFLIFANDGRAYQPIVIDLLASMTWDFESFLAHEFHHWYRNQGRTFDPDLADPADADLLWALDQIQAEGVADQIDKRAWLMEGADPPLGRERYAEAYRRHLESTPELLATLDSLLIRYSGEPDVRAEIGAEIRELIPQSGHPTGFFMADLILEQLGLEALTQELGNPFAFVRAFDRAADRAAKPDLQFSAEALALLDELERRYVQQ